MFIGKLYGGVGSLGCGRSHGAAMLHLLKKRGSEQDQESGLRERVTARMGGGDTAEGRQRGHCLGLAGRQ